MIFKDSFDYMIVAGLVLALVFTGVVLTGATSSQDSHAASSLNRQMERELLYQARVSFIERHYSPVLALRDKGSLPDALLKLEELGRTLPGEAHNDLLSGDILLRMGQFDRSLEKLASAVRSNADYVDMASPLNQRTLIESAVTEALPLVRDRLRAQPDSRSLSNIVKDGYYLQSRLAGGCE